MENHILHFSSPRQNNDFIVYHNRAKSTLGGSQTARLKAKTLAPESSRDYNNKRSRPDRHGPAASSDFTSPSHGFPLHNRINIVKELMDSSAQSNTNKQSLVLDAENEKRMNELEEEIKELRKRLKARDVRINYLVQENETAREKLNEVRHIENQNSLFQNENKCLKSEVEILTKRVNELEEEKASNQSDKHSKQKINDEEVSRGLAKYARHIINSLDAMESNNVANFYFEERFLSERHLSKLVKTKDYGLIALNAFRYISDLLAHPAQSKRDQRDQQKKTHLMPKEKKEYKVQPSEPSSICLSPLKNDSKENTPRSLVRELEGRGVMVLEGFDKVHEVRKDTSHKVSRSAEGRNQNQDLMKKCLTARESKHNIQIVQNVQKSTSGTAATTATTNPLKTKNQNQNQNQVMPSSKGQKGSYAQMHAKGDGGRVRTKESVDREGESTKHGHILLNKRRETEDKEKQATLVSSKRSDMRYRETEEDEIARVEKGLRSENPGSLAKRRVQTEEAETYASLGVNIKTFGEGHYGRRTKEYEKNDRESDSAEGDDVDLKHPMSVRSLLRHGLGGQDQKDEDYNRKEKIEAKMQQHLSPRDFHNVFENDSYEKRVESKKMAERGGFEDGGREFMYNSKVSKGNNRGGAVYENNFTEDSGFEKYLEEEINASKKRHKKSHTQTKLNLTNSRRGVIPYEGEDNSEKMGRPLNMSHESNNNEAPQSHIVRESLSYGKKYYQPPPQQIERLDDVNRNIQSSKDSLRLYSVQSPNRPFSVQGNTPGGFENIAERVVTFDGTDSQSLFVSEREPSSGHGKKPGHRPSESEYYSLGPPKNIQHQRFSSDIHAASIAEALMKKRMDQNLNAQEQLYRKSIESKRVKQGRGDFNI